jgi:hypothetical protein
VFFGEDFPQALNYDVKSGEFRGMGWGREKRKGVWEGEEKEKAMI